MKPQSIIAAACVAALGVTACEGSNRQGANSKICADFKTAATPAAGAPADAAQPMDECVRRWAYSLAPSTDAADAVAEASVAACSAVLARWNQQSLSQASPEGEGMSITTGQPTNPLAEHNAFAHNRALFYVVQARAGRCAPPPVKDGVPEGLPS